MSSPVEATLVRWARVHCLQDPAEVASLESHSYMQGPRWGLGMALVNPLSQAAEEGLQETAGTKRPLVTWKRKLFRGTRFPAGEGMEEELRCAAGVSRW